MRMIAHLDYGTLSVDKTVGNGRLRPFARALHDDRLE